MTSYMLRVNETTRVSATVVPSAGGFISTGCLISDYPDGYTETYGETKETHYSGYCLTEVIGFQMIETTGNYPRIAAEWTPWEGLKELVPSCGCED